MKKFLVIGLAIAAFASIGQAQTVFNVELDGAQVPTASTFTGIGTVTLNGAGTQITVAVTHNVPIATLGHIHQGPTGVNGGVIFGFSSGASPVNEVFAISPAQVAVLQSEGYYVNIHTASFPGGEIRGQIVNQPVPTPISPWVTACAAAIIMIIAMTASLRRLSPQS